MLSTKPCIPLSANEEYTLVPTDYWNMYYVYGAHMSSGAVRWMVESSSNIFE